MRISSVENPPTAEACLRIAPTMLVVSLLRQWARYGGSQFHALYEFFVLAGAVLSGPVDEGRTS